MKKEAAIIAIIFAISLAIRLQPAAYDPVIGIDGHYHARMAERLMQGKLYDELSFGGRPYLYPPGMHLMIGAAAAVAGTTTEAAGRILVTIIGAAAVIPAYFIGRRWGMRAAIAAALLLAFTPVHIWKTSSNIITDGAVLTLVLLSLYFAMEKRHRAHFAVSILAIIFSPLPGLLALSFRIFDFKFKWSFVAAAAAAAILLALSLSYVSGIYFGGLDPDIRAALQEDISVGELLFRLNPLALAFGIAGLAVLRQKTDKRLLWWLAVMAVAAGFLETDRLLFYTAPLLALLAGYSISRIREKRWYALIIAAIIVSGVFLSAAGLDRLKWGVISAEEKQAYDWIKENTPENATIAATITEGHWISNLGKRKNIIDGNIAGRSDVNERYADVRAIFTSNDKEKAVVAAKYNASYVLYSQRGRQAFGEMETGFPIEFSNNFTTVFRVTESG